MGEDAETKFFKAISKYETCQEAHDRVYSIRRSLGTIDSTMDRLQRKLAVDSYEADVMAAEKALVFAAVMYAEEQLAKSQKAQPGPYSE